jgi:hypothetical protein
MSELPPIAAAATVEVEPHPLLDPPEEVVQVLIEVGAEVLLVDARGGERVDG